MDLNGWKEQLAKLPVPKFKNKKMQVMAIAGGALVLVIAGRILMNLHNERVRAQRLSLAKPVAVPTAFPRRSVIVPEYRFSGSLDPVWQAQVAAKIDARLTHVYVREGDEVKKGQVLAEFETVDRGADLLSARGSYADAAANYERAKLDFERYEKLFKQGAISEQSVDNYRFALQNAEGKLHSAEGVLQAMQSQYDATQIVAPADGTVYKRFYQEGYYAKAGTPVFSIADVSKLKISVNVPEGNIGSVAEGNVAKVFLSAYPGLELTGKIVRIAPVADLPSHTFLTEIAVDNSRKLKAGVFATVSLKGEPKENILTVPPYAIVMRDDQRTAYVVDNEGVVSRRVLTVGYMNDDVAEITQGLTERDRIVTGGQNKLREGSKIIMKDEQEAEAKK